MKDDHHTSFWNAPKRAALLGAFTLCLANSLGKCLELIDLLRDLLDRWVVGAFKHLEHPLQAPSQAPRVQELGRRQGDLRTQLDRDCVFTGFSFRCCRKTDPRVLVSARRCVSR